MLIRNDWPQLSHLPARHFWSDFATWISRAEVPKAPLLALRPGLGNPQLQIHEALKLLRQHLLFKAFYGSFEAKSVSMRAGTVRPNKTGWTESRVLMPRLPKRSWKGGAKHRLVWICQLTTLRSLLINFQLVTVDSSVWRCIVSEGSSQLTIRPKITELKDAQCKAVFLGEDGMRVVVILYADLHHYFLVYESMRHAARTCVIPIDGGDCCSNYMHSVLGADGPV
jgi:hypothetical protein